MISGQILTSASPCEKLSRLFCTPESVLSQGKEPLLLCPFIHWLGPLMGVGVGQWQKGAGSCVAGVQLGKKVTYTNHSQHSTQTQGDGVTMPRKGA